MKRSAGAGMAAALALAGAGLAGEMKPGLAGRRSFDIRGGLALRFDEQSGRLEYKDGTFPMGALPALAGAKDGQTTAASTVLAGGGMALTLSRLSPAVLLETRERTLRLLSAAEVGQVAFAAAGGTKVVASSPVRGDELAEAWMLVLRKDARDVNGFILHSDRRPVWRVRTHAPVLIVFARRPTEVSWGRRGLAVTFAKGSGPVAVVPPWGYARVDAAEGKNWPGALPEAVVRRCRQWAARARALPVDVTESYRWDSGRLLIRGDYTFRVTADDWRTQPQKFAPLPPFAAALHLVGNRFVKVDRPEAVVDTRTPNAYGPYAGVPGRSVSYTLGAGRYVWQRVVTDRVSLPADVRSRLHREVQATLAAGHLCPLVKHLFGRTYGSLYDRPAELAHTLAAAGELLDVGTQEKIRKYLKAELAGYPPSTRTPLPANVGTVRTWYRQNALEIQRLKKRPDIGEAYGLWWYHRFTGDDAFVQRVWPKYEAFLTDYDKAADWALGFNGGNIFELHDGAAGLIGYARLAASRGRTDEADWAAYLAAKALAARLACSYYFTYLLRTGLLTMPDPQARAFSYGTNQVMVFQKWRSGRCILDARHLTTLLRDRSSEYQIVQIGRGWSAPAVFWGLVPETARLLGDHNRDICDLLDKGIERFCPGWYMTNHPRGDLCPMFSLEHSVIGPEITGPLFRAKAYIQRADVKTLRRCLPLPFCKVGDLSHIRNLAALLRAAGRTSWRDVRE